MKIWWFFSLVKLKINNKCHIIGTLEKGTFEKGTLEKGTFEKGTFEKGTFEKGTFGKGTKIINIFIIIVWTKIKDYYNHPDFH